MRFLTKLRRSNSDAIVAALQRSLAVIEFAPDGSVLTANSNFLDLMGYQLPEVQRRHHGIFLDAADRQTQAYTDFWARLRGGEFVADEFRRITKSGREVWIQGTYNPVFDGSGKVIKVVKFATDITQQKLDAAHAKGQIAAINRSQAMIEFSTDGTVLSANENFLGALGYSSEEIVGKHHSIFLPAGEADTPAYTAFWDELRGGKFRSDEFLRIGKGGKEVWILASYNPIYDLNGRVYRVVKFATDITEEVTLRHKRAAARESIDADLDGIARSVTATAGQATTVSSTSEQTSAAVQSIAAGIEELAASAHEIGSQLVRATEITKSAVSKATDTNQVIGGLAESARRITEVVSLIEGIAEQTNLLALNATIEAARAGEAGKGFAVVAAEVKELANQASRATGEIADQIAQVQSATEGAVAAIATISKTISEIDEVASSVAGAVEEQSCVTRELSGNMQEVASGVETITVGIREIAVASGNIDTATKSVRELSRAVG